MTNADLTGRNRPAIAQWRIWLALTAVLVATNAIVAACTPGSRAVAREGAALAAPGMYQPAVAAVLELAQELCADVRDDRECLVRCLAECERRRRADAGYKHSVE